jgi:hypothetical protein
VLPHSGIDIDARWGYSHTKGWVFGYKLHLTSTTAGALVVPLTDDVTTTNVQDNHMCITLTSSFLIFVLPCVLYIIADPGYDDKKLYVLYSKKIFGIDLVCPVERYESTSKKRIELVCFYESERGQTIYNQRMISIEPLIEHIKSVFKIDQLPAHGFQV